MDPEDELTLSFYKEITKFGDSQNVSLVQKIDTNEIFVKKEYKSCDTRVFDVLKQSGFSGTPRIYECIRDTENNRTTIIEEHINGKTLRTILDMNGTMPKDDVISIAAAICDILRPIHMHEPPVIHRDIKPENVMIKDGVVYLVDFDASKLYSEGSQRDTELLGTASYAAPEQYGFLQSDPRTDIYAIGVLIREMSTGSSESVNDSAGPFSTIIRKCTCMDPDDRYQNVTELKCALLELMPPAYSDPTSTGDTEETYTSYALPGFRGKNMGVKIVAAFLYFLAIYSSLTYTQEGISTAALWANRVLVLTVIIALTLLFGNYRGIVKILPFTNSENKAVRILGYVFYAFIILFFLGLIASIIDKYL